jgi:hypothetical protein
MRPTVRGQFALGITIRLIRQYLDLGIIQPKAAKIGPLVTDDDVATVSEIK